jgi:DNA-binding PadR family transcriptional regulator
MTKLGVMLLKSDEIKIAILQFLFDGQARTANEISTKFRVNSLTVRRNCLFMQKIGLLEIISSRPRLIEFKITESGREVVTELRNQQG